MNRCLACLFALLLSACDSKVSPISVDESERQSDQITDADITDLQAELEIANKSTANLRDGFEAKKAELERKIKQARKEHEELRAIQVEHYSALEKEFQEAALELKKATGEMAIWDPIQIDSISVMRDEVIKILDENKKLRAEIERLKQTRQ